jgi:hypothetical protein
MDIPHPHPHPAPFPICAHFPFRISHLPFAVCRVRKPQTASPIYIVGFGFGFGFGFGHIRFHFQSLIY